MHGRATAYSLYFLSMSMKLYVRLLRALTVPGAIGAEEGLEEVGGAEEVGEQRRWCEQSRLREQRRLRE